MSIGKRRNFEFASVLLTHFYSFSECECISVYSFVLSGFASVSVFRNWVFVIVCGFAKIKVIF